MLRFFTSQGLYEIWKGSYLVASCAAKRQATGFLSASSSNFHQIRIPACLFNTGVPVWKDALQPKTDNSEETQTLDLDKWKSVMKEQRTSKEKQKVTDEDEASDDENLKEAGSSLEATRDLVAMWQQAGKLVPQEMTDEEVQNLAQLTTKSSRKKYLKYLAIKEGHKRARKEKQQQKKSEREEQRREQDSHAEEEGQAELKNTLFLQFWGRSLDKHLAWRSAQAMMFGQPLVFDMSYESNMARRELENTVSQLMEVEGWNRRSAEPFHLHFCNLQPDGGYHKELLKRYGAEAWERLMVTSTAQQHVDRFPREQLVYLTADSPNVVRSFDHSKIYIIGALVDRSIQSGLSRANAKRLNLATARLPLDEFLHWEIGAKNLTLDQMIRIMLTLKETGKWEDALQFVPKRKFDGFHQERALKVATNSTVTGATSHGPRLDGDRQIRPGVRNSEKKSKHEGQINNRSHKETEVGSRGSVSGLYNNRENKVTRVRSSLQAKLEGRKGAGKGKMWWDNE